MSQLRSKLRKAILQPYKIPGYFVSQFNRNFNAVGATRIIWPEPGRALLIDFDMRRPIDHEVLVLTHTTLVSPGTERAFFNALPNARPEYPYFPGYCGAGVVVEVGSKVTRFKPGDRVAGAIPHASAMLMPEDWLTRVPDAVSLEQATFLQLGIIALQGVRKARIQLGERVAVIGQGLIGLLTTQLVAQNGAYPVFAIANSDTRLPLAKRLGATRTYCLDDKGSQFDGLVYLSKIQADVTIDVTGSPDALHTAIGITYKNGRIVSLGSTRGTTHGIDFHQLRERNLKIIGAHVDSLPKVESRPGLWTAKKEAETFFKLVAKRRLNIDALISHHIYPPEAERFYRKLSRAERSILGALFSWNHMPHVERLNGRLRDRLDAKNTIWSISPASVSTVSTNGTRSKNAVNGSAMKANKQLPQSTSPTLTENKTLRVGLIGCGEIALKNAQAIKDSDNAEIVMVADINASIAADMGKRYKVPHSTDSEALLRRDDVDAVLISVPHHLHAPLTIQAAEYGKHVMVEKPLSTSLADADRMIDACKQSGVQLSTMYCQRYLPYVQKAKALIDQGALGNILGMQLIFYMDKPPSYFQSGFSGRVQSDWRLLREKSGGGILIFNLVHYLDIMRYLSGLEVVRAYAEFGTLDTPMIETEDTISATLRYSNQAIGTISASSVARGSPYKPQLHLWGSDGQMYLTEPDDFSFYSLREIDGKRPGVWYSMGSFDMSGERRAYVTSFAQSVLGGSRPEVSGEDGRAIQAIVEAIYKSGRQQHFIGVERT